MLDTSFGSGGVLTLSSAAVRLEGRYGVSGIALRPNGQVFLAGIGSPSGAQTSFAAQLNANGTFDTTFGSGGIFFDTALIWANGLAVQPNGEILVIGVNTIGSSSEAYQVDRVQAGGSGLDPAFGSGGSVQIAMPNEGWESAAITLGPDGKIIGIGTCGTSSYSEFLTFRLLNDITSDAAAAAPASAVAAPSATGIMALTPDLIAPAPLSKRSGTD